MIVGDRIRSENFNVLSRLVPSLGFYVFPGGVVAGFSI